MQQIKTINLENQSLLKLLDYIFDILSLYAVGVLILAIDDTLDLHGQRPMYSIIFKMIATTINIEDELEKIASFISFKIYRLIHY